MIKNCCYFLLSPQKISDAVVCLSLFIYFFFLFIICFYCNLAYASKRCRYDSFICWYFSLFVFIFVHFWIWCVQIQFKQSNWNGFRCAALYFFDIIVIMPVSYQRNLEMFIIKMINKHLLRSFKQTIIEWAQLLIEISIFYLSNLVTAKYTSTCSTGWLSRCSVKILFQNIISNNKVLIKVGQL